VREDEDRGENNGCCVVSRYDGGYHRERTQTVKGAWLIRL
jgi:hypothetical protein